MFSDKINDPNDALEIQNILDIEAIQLQTGEHDDDSDPYEDDQQFQEHDSYDDFFGNVDSNGHDLVSSLSSTSKTIMPKVLSVHTTFYEASIKEASNGHKWFQARVQPARPSCQKCYQITLPSTKLL